MPYNFSVPASLKWAQSQHKNVQDEKIKAFLYWGATLHNLQVVLLEVLREILV